MSDERVQRVTDLMLLKKKDVAMFWKTFRKFDKERVGIITLETFFSEICKSERNLFGDAIFDLIDTEDTANIEFGEFVQGVCTFAMFQVVDVLRFSFFIFDKDKNGYIDRDELELFVRTLHDGGVQGNIMHALKSVDFNGDGKFDFGEFSALHEKFPTVLYPAFRLQTEMMANVMGSSWWNSKKAELAFIKESEIKKLDDMRRKEEKKLIQERNNMIRTEIGVIDYLRGSKKKDYLLRMNPDPEVYIDANREVQIRYPDKIHLPGDDAFLKKEEDDEEDANPNKRAGASGL